MKVEDEARLKCEAEEKARKEEDEARLKREAEEKASKQDDTLPSGHAGHAAPAPPPPPLEPRTSSPKPVPVQRDAPSTKNEDAQRKEEEASAVKKAEEPAAAKEEVAMPSIKSSVVPIEVQSIEVTIAPEASAPPGKIHPISPGTEAYKNRYKVLNNKPTDITDGKSETADEPKKCQCALM